MNPWTCALLISVAGAVGGTVNALFTDNGFLLPRTIQGVWCPGFISNISVGALAAFASWALYGSGAGLDLANLAERAEISLRFSALAGAFFVGVAGAKYITSVSDSQLLKESVRVANLQKMTPDDCEKLVQGSPRQVLERVQAA